MSTALSSLSDAIAALASAAAPWLAAIRIDPRTHLTGIAWADGLVVTTDRALPIRDVYTVVLSGGTLVAARPWLRDPSLDLVLLRLERVFAITPLPAAPAPAVGSLAVVVGADFDVSPTVRVAVVHRRGRTAGQGAVLDLTDAQCDPGALVLAADGAVLGMAHTEPDGAVTIVPHATIGRLVQQMGVSAAPRVAKPGPPPTEPPAASGRGWFGIALQPITVPDALVARAGQSSGRLIVGISAGGPAEQAGLRVGDVLLSLGGLGTTGANSLRGFLESNRVGTRVEVRVLRDAAVASTWLTVAEQP